MVEYIILKDVIISSLSFRTFQYVKPLRRGQLTSLQGTNGLSPMYPLFGGFTVYRKPLGLEHLALRDKMLVPNGVRHRGVPL